MSVVTYDSSENIAVIAINRPKKRNAVSVAVVEELAQAWRRFNVGDDRVAVLTATGDQSFTVGADLNDIPQDLWRAVPGIGIEVEKPIVGAGAGWVVGGGFVLANQCDLLVAADNATFLYPEARVGFSGGLISSLAARIPHKIAMEVLLVGEALSAQRAYEVGFVNRIVPVGEQLRAALDPLLGPCFGAGCVPYGRLRQGLHQHLRGWHRRWPEPFLAYEFERELSW